MYMVHNNCTLMLPSPASVVCKAVSTIGSKSLFISMSLWRPVAKTTTSWSGLHDIHVIPPFTTPTHTNYTEKQRALKQMHYGMSKM